MNRGRAVFGGLTVAAIGTIAALAFTFGRPDAYAEAPGSVPLIKADTTPIKIKPKDPGGLKVPHKDISIYERLETPRKVVPAGDPGKTSKKSKQVASTKPDGKNADQDIGPYRVQLGSFATTESAQRGWTRLRAKYPELIGGLQMVLERVEARSKRTIIRLQAGPLKSATDAQTLCAALAKRKVGCFPIKG